MPRTSSNDSPIRSLVDDFVTRLVAAVEAQATQRVQQQVLAALGAGGPRRPGRHPKNPPPLFSFEPIRRRPKQLCPVPGCSNPAAPVFGMVCSKHKDVPKAQIKKYREARREEKTKGKGAKGRGAAAKPAAAAAAR